MKNVNSILVVGSGTAGLIAAILLKRKLNLKVDVVYSKNIGIIGVGEGSTEHWKEFMDVAGIDQYTLLKECDATFKSGIMFEEWTDKPYFHNVIDPYSKQSGQYHCVYGKQISENGPLSSKNIWDSRINKWFLNRPEEFHAFQFHFNTHKLNDFLIRFASTIGINFYDDEIQDITFREDGSIHSVKGNTHIYEYDFYIDSTGFKRVLMNRLNANWISFKKYLKMKSAITFQTGDEENYNYWTLAKAMDYGWRFKIPVWGRHGNGYIFDSDYITAEQAHRELEQEFGKNIDIGKQFFFDPGYLENVWIKNCCAIGLSGSFVEPLEATSIGTSIQQSFLLVYQLNNYTEKTIENYNKSFKDIMENIRDFIVLHYITKKTNTDFWRDVSNLELPDTLKNNLEIWKNRLPIREDFANLSNYILFRSANFIVVMEGLDLFNKESIKSEFLKHSNITQNYAHDSVDEFIEYEKNIDYISHKKFIELIRSEF